MRTLSILIVDDNKALLQGIRYLLSISATWSVCDEAADGLEAVDKAKRLRPDVVLMDVSMPRMDGAQATRILRREVPESEVIIVSQNDPAICRRQSQEVGAAAYVAKSDLARELIPTLERLGGYPKTEPTDVGENMGGCPESQIGDAVDNSLDGSAVPVESILRTAVFRRRPSRPPDYE